MKRIIYMFFVLAFICSGTNAQQDAVEGLKIFVNELKELECEHVRCEMQGFNSFIDENIDVEISGNVDVAKLLGRLNNPEWQFLVVQSNDKEGYNAIYEFLDKYDVMEADELFGIPLAVNTREDAHQSTIFVDENNSLIIEESDLEITLIYTNCNIVNVLTQAMRMVAMGLDDYFGELVERGVETLAHIGDKLENENHVFTEEKPKVGYDFYNLEDLKSKLHYADVVDLITPEDVAMQYMTRYLPKAEWIDEGYHENVKNIYKDKYPGGTPAVLYAFAKSESRYKMMTDAFGHLFNLGLKDVYNGLKVIQRSDRNGKRFIQFYGEGNVMFTMLDIPATDSFIMTVTIGGEKDFENAVNAYSINGKCDIAKKNVVILDQNGVDVRLNDSDVDDRMQNGVYFNFGLKEKFLE